MIRKTYSVFCDVDGCIQWIARTADGTKGAWEWALAAGWVRRGNRDLCPDHVDETIGD